MSVEQSPITILCFAANPATTTRLELDEEVRAIEQVLRASEHRDAIRLVSRWATRADDLLQQLNEQRPTIVHFSGHGDAAGGLRVHDERSAGHVIAPEAVAQLFRALRGDIRVVVLNACYSRVQAEAIAGDVDCVVGMNHEIGDVAAQVFARSFYRAIGFGGSVKAAFEQGKAALQLAGIPEHGTPTLIARPGVDPDAVFPLRAPPAPAATIPRIAMIAAAGDLLWLRKLQIHLKPLVRGAGVELWDSSMIEAGVRWRDAVADGFARARVVVVVIGPELFADDEFVAERLPALIARADAESIRLLSLIVSTCAFASTPLATFKPLNFADDPLDALPPAELNRRLATIAERIVASARR